MNNNNQAEHDEAFFCSELIARAFEEAWLPLFDNLSAHAITPGRIAKSNKLRYIETLVEETT